MTVAHCLSSHPLLIRAFQTALADLVPHAQYVNAREGTRSAMTVRNAQSKALHSPRSSLCHPLAAKGKRSVTWAFQAVI